MIKKTTIKKALKNSWKEILTVIFWFLVLLSISIEAYHYKKTNEELLSLIETDQMFCEKILEMNIALNVEHKIKCQKTELKKD